MTFPVVFVGLLDQPGADRVPVTFQGLVQCPVAYGGGKTAGQDYDIQPACPAQFILVQPETLAYQALQPISAYRPTAYLSRYRHTQATKTLVIGPRQDTKATVPGHRRARKHKTEISLRT